MKKFLKWATENGAFIHPNVSILERDGQFGVFSTAEICASADFLSIPHSIVICLENILQESNFMKSLGIPAFKLSHGTENILVNIDDSFSIESAGTVDEISADDLLLLCLCHARIDKTSPWHFYAVSLPTTCDSPLSWTEKEIQVRLGGTSLCQVSLDRRKTLESDFHSLNEILSLPFTLKDYIWACEMKNSRSFVFMPPFGQNLDNTCPTINAVRGLKGTSCFLPLLDLLNHKPVHKITWLSTESALKFICPDSIASGEEIFNNYGPKSNEELLLAYGFCIDSNSQLELDYVRLPIRSRDKGDEISIIYLHQNLFELDQLLLNTKKLLVNHFPENLLSLQSIVVLLELLGSKHRELPECCSKSSVEIYITSQKLILKSAIEKLHRLLNSTHQDMCNLLFAHCDQITIEISCEDDHLEFTSIPKVLYKFQRAGLKTSSKIEKGTVIATINPSLIFYETSCDSENTLLERVRTFELSNLSDLPESEKIKHIIERFDSIEDKHNIASYQHFLQTTLVRDYQAFSFRRNRGCFILPEPLNEIRISYTVGNVALCFDKTKLLNLVALTDMEPNTELALAACSDPVGRFSTMQTLVLERGICNISKH